MAQHPLFRSEAIKHALRQQERQVLPVFTRLPVIIFIWLLVLLAIGTGYVAWDNQIPVYTNSSGIILAQQDQVYPQHDIAEVALFLPANQVTRVQRGQTLLVDISGTQLEVSGTVVRVSTQTLSPLALNARYGHGIKVVMKPSYVVIAELPELAAATFEGSTVSANIQTGSQRILALLLGIGS